MSPILNTRHGTFRKAQVTDAVVEAPVAPLTPAVPVAILTDDIVIGMPLIEAWKHLSFDDLLYCIQIANPDTHIRRIQICNGGLSVRIFV